MLNVYRAYFVATINTQFQYRIALLIWLIGLVIQPIVTLVVWQTVAAGGSVQGFTASDFAAYFLVLMIANQVTFTWIMWEYEFQIKSGQFATLLMKPIHPIHRHIADNASFKLLTLVVVLPTFVILNAVFHPTYHTTLLDLVLFIPALLLGAAMRYLIEYTLALAAFFTTRVTALNQLYDGIVWILSGQLAPLALLPGPVSVVARLSPFGAMVSFPVELVLGRLDTAGIITGFATQVVWLALAYLGFRSLWGVSVRSFSAVGT